MRIELTTLTVAEAIEFLSWLETNSNLEGSISVREGKVTLRLERRV